MSTINGQDYQHSLIDLNFNTPNGNTLKALTFTALSYKPSAEKKPVRDSQGQIIRYTISNQSIDASLSLLRSEWVVLRPQLLNLFGGQLGILQIQLDLSVVYGNSVLNYQTDTLQGVMFQSDGFDSKNEQNALEVELPLFVQSVKLAGVAPVIYR